MPAGPLVGGWLLNHYWWGAVFVFNVPVAAVALVAAVWLLPGDRAPAAGAAPFDAAGTVLSTVGITALVYGTILVPDDGWGSPRVLAGIFGGAAVLAGFLVRQRRTAHPLVDLGLFADRAFRWGTLLAVFVNFAVMGILFVVPQYLQSVLGHDAFGTGLRILPLIAGLMVAAAASEPVANRFGPRLVIPAGLLLLATGTLLGATTTAGDGYGTAALWLALIGVGFGTAMVPATGLVMGSLPAERSGQGTSLLETVQQVGGVLGVAALGSVLSSGYLGRLDTDRLDPAAARAARDSVTGADAVAARLHDGRLLGSGLAAFTHGMDLVLLTCGACAALAAVLGLLLLPRKAPAAPAADLAGSPARPVLPAHAAADTADGVAAGGA
jgi:MFS family permease